jgi:hypothetical protein
MCRRSKAILVQEVSLYLKINVKRRTGKIYFLKTEKEGLRFFFWSEISQVFGWKENPRFKAEEKKCPQRVRNAKTFKQEIHAVYRGTRARFRSERLSTIATVPTLSETHFFWTVSIHSWD